MSLKKPTNRRRGKFKKIVIRLNCTTINIADQINTLLITKERDFEAKKNQINKTVIPNRKLQLFYREICVQGNSNYVIWECKGFEGSNFNEIQGNIHILHRNLHFISNT